MPKKKIIFVLEATAGGTRRHLSDILLNIDLQKFEVSAAVATRRSESFQADIRLFSERSIKIHLVKMQREINLFQDFKAFLALIKLLRHGDYDIIHTHSSKAGILGRFAGWLCGIRKRLHTPHVFPFQMAISPVKRFCYTLLERLAGKLTTTLVAVCEAEKQEALAHRILPVERIKVIPNGIDAAFWQPDPSTHLAQRQAFGFSDSDIIIGLVGRFVPQKGHHVLIEAAQNLASKKESAHFKYMLIGDGPLQATLEQQVKAAQLEAKITFHKETDTIRDIYNMLDIIVIPSLWEALPYILLEAMAMEKVVICSEIGGMPDVIDNQQNGFILPECTGTCLADTLLKMSNVNFQAIGQAARQTVASKYQLQSMLNELQQLYLEN